MVQNNMYNQEIKTDRYNFHGGFQGRDSSTTKDQRLVNLYQETVAPNEKVILVKRPGLTQYTVQTAGTGRGIWTFNGSIWYVIGNTLYKNTTATGTTLATTTGTIGWTTCTSSGAARLFFCDGTNAYVIDTTDTVTQVTDVDFPSPHVATPVYIDGYVCIPKASSADIYNSDLENPLSWTASNFITAEILSDRVLGLARQNNQVVAFGEDSTEFFYNAANPTGTPLGRNLGAFLQLGTCAPHAIGQNEKYCFFLAASQTGGRCVWKLDGFQPTQVSTAAINRVLDAEGTNITNATAYLLRLGGHFFFVICLTSRTLVYDVIEDFWHEWTSTTQSTITDTQINGKKAVNYLRPVNAVPSTTAIFNTTQFKYPYAADIGSGTVYVLGASSGVVGLFSATAYKDIDQIIRCEVNTGIMDFNTYKRKFLHRLTVVGDLASNTIFLKWSDDDYQTWSGIKNLAMSSRPVFHRLGSFRRRAFNIYYTDNYPLRLEGLDLIYSEGEA